MPIAYATSDLKKVGPSHKPTPEEDLLPLIPEAFLLFQKIIVEFVFFGNTQWLIKLWLNQTILIKTPHPDHPSAHICFDLIH